MSWREEEKTGEVANTSNWSNVESKIVPQPTGGEKAKEEKAIVQEATPEDLLQLEVDAEIQKSTNLDAEIYKSFQDYSKLSLREREKHEADADVQDRMNKAGDLAQCFRAIANFADHASPQLKCSLFLVILILLGIWGRNSVSLSNSTC